MRGRLESVLIKLLLLASFFAFASVASPQTQGSQSAARLGKHFDQVLIVVLENQNYSSAMKDPFLAELATKGSVFTNFKNLTHPSYPNYLAMIAGSTLERDGSDKQKNFPDTIEDRTIADLLDWRNYAENYPGSDKDCYFLKDPSGSKYARKHVPFLSFIKVQKESCQRVVSVDTKTGNPFVTDISNFRKDPQKNPLPQYMFYSPNLDDDGHDPYVRPKVGLKKASTWLHSFLKDWLAFDDKTWVPSDAKLNKLLVVVTFDESEGSSSNNIYTVFLGNMLKTAQAAGTYDHYSVLRTIEDNFGLDPIHKESGDGTANLITEVWK